MTIDSLLKKKRKVSTCVSPQEGKLQLTPCILLRTIEYQEHAERT